MGKLSKAFDKGVVSREETGKEAVSSSVEMEPTHYDSSTSIDETSLASSSPLGKPEPSIRPPQRSNWDERIALATETSSLIAESFRKLRAEILYSSREKPIKSIMVTSCDPTEGKGFVCANLGVSIAQGLEQHALIVDCDLRKPTLSKLFGVPNKKGLADYLQKDMDLSEIIMETGQPKLSVIPSGPDVKNPSELLESSKMVRLLEELSVRYDDRFIILDSPPLRVAAETSVLVNYIDAVVMVVRWGVSDRVEIKRLINSIDKDKIIGIVFNAFEENFLDKLLKGKGYYGYYGGTY